jgi:hypothetical protein
VELGRNSLKPFPAIRGIHVKEDGIGISDRPGKSKPLLFEVLNFQQHRKHGQVFDFEEVMSLLISLKLWQRSFLPLRVLRHHRQIFQGDHDISAQIVLETESGGSVVPTRGSPLAHRPPVFFSSLLD